MTVTSLPGKKILCRWWIAPICDEPGDHLLLATCRQGHIRERVLCETHTDITILCITAKHFLCPRCSDPLLKYMTANPIENHWQLQGAALDREPIYPAGDPEGHGNYIIHDSHLYRGPSMYPACTPYLGILRILTVIAETHPELLLDVMETRMASIIAEKIRP